MRLYLFDIEVFAFDWIIVFKNHTTGMYITIHNDVEKLNSFIADDIILCGFNNKHYDNYIMKAILAGGTHAQIKELSDYIIIGMNPWEHPWLSQQHAPWINSFDLFDDCQQGLSLKAIEAHLGMPIKETEVDFNLKRPLTRDEVDMTIEYCRHDVDATETLLGLRSDYLNGKLSVARMKGISETKALFYTNAKLVSLFLGATKQPHSDEREYQPPAAVMQLRQYIPDDVYDFFQQIHDQGISNEELFHSKLTTKIGNCPTQYGYGGAHGSQLCYTEAQTPTRMIINKDVASMYPSLMIVYGFASRNIKSFDDYKAVYERRINAKKSGDEHTSKTLKLVLNSTFGATGAPFNDMYDPLMFRSVCITGQLLITALAIWILRECPTAKMLNINTDGIMYSISADEAHHAADICDTWSYITKLNLETDIIKKVCIKDVNNLIYQTMDGHVKKVGGYLTHGITIKGAFNINNNYPIVKEAVAKYLIDDTPVKDTINADNNILDFQIVAKAGGIYRKVYQIINGNEVLQQQCNRVYATKDTSYGTLMKVHSISRTTSKVAGLPDHCIVDNDNTMTIDMIDRQWYINLANRYIDDFTDNKLL